MPLPDLLSGGCGGSSAILQGLLAYPHRVTIYPAPATESSEGVSGPRGINYDGTRPAATAEPAPLWDAAGDVQDAPQRPHATAMGDAEEEVDAIVFLPTDPLALGVAKGCPLVWVGGPTGATRGSVRRVRALDGAVLVEWD